MKLLEEIKILKSNKLYLKQILDEGRILSITSNSGTNIEPEPFIIITREYKND